MSLLFANYDTSVKPGCQQGPIVVTVGLAVRQLIDLEEPKQILYLNTWMRLQWDDCQLRWNSSDYGNISTLTLPYDRVWTPDITLYDSTDGEVGYLKEYRVSVTSEGKVSYNYPYLISATCQVDVTYFPFDTQRCPLQFGSWAYSGLQLDVTNRSQAGDISSFIANSEFHLDSIPLERHELYYACCPEPYPDVTFYVIVKRKPTFYVINLLFPCILITSVAALGFILPPDAGEKIGLEITVLLALAVFQLLLSEAMPPSSETFPMIGVYFACSMVLVMLSTILTVLVLNVHHTEHKRLPKLVRVIFLDKLARVVCYKKDASVQPQEDEVPFNRSLSNGLAHSYDGKGHKEKGINRPHLPPSRSDNSKAHNESSPLVIPSEETSSSELLPLLNVLQEHLDLMKQAEERKDQKQEHEHQKGEWKKLAIVLDRLFLMLFVLMSFITSLAVLVSLTHQ
ncbi:hypothetical protein BaRGS_00012735 [Batillaria attramentaria]|uniref:Uncharacterized protein n=1 Tax=Batillaria attramentaria TaxID=370345 RepID=A0ABD0L8Y7_9CAEN